MGSRRRKKERGRAEEARPNAAARSPAAVTPPTETRSEARNRAAREGLEPLALGERPWPLVAAALLALASAVGNAAYAVTSPETTREAIGPLLLSIILVVTAIGLWRGRYWAVLGMEALLGLSIILIALNLLAFAGPVQIVAGVILIGGLGYLFWKLVRLLARIQMPERP